MPKSRFLIAILILFISIGILFLGTAYFFMGTTKGSNRAMRFLMSRFIKAEKKTFEDMNGSLEKGVSLKNVELSNLAGLPEGSVIRIQKLDVLFDAFDIKKVNVAVENGRVILPHCEPIVLTGNYSGGNLAFNVFSKEIDVNDMVGFSDSADVRRATGAISDIDLYVTGALDQAQVEGNFKIGQLTKSEFSLAESDGWLKLIFSSPDGFGKDFEPTGTILFKNGIFSMRKIRLQLEPSKIIYSGDFSDPGFDVRGTATIDDFKITLTLQGTRSVPILEATSVPPRSRDQLLVMLATGKSWEDVGAATDQNQISSQLAGDIVNFFLLLGDHPWVKALGLTDATIKYDDQTKGIGVKTKITDFLKVGYEIDQHTTAEQGEPPNITHKVGGEIKVGPNLSISAEKEFQPKQDVPQTTEIVPTDDKVLLKFKTDF